MACDGHRHIGGGAAVAERSIPRSKRSEPEQISPPPTPQRERPALAPVPDVEREETGKEAKAAAVKPESHHVSIEEAILLEGMMKESGETDPKKLMQSALGVLNLMHEYQLDEVSRNNLGGMCREIAKINQERKKEKERATREEAARKKAAEEASRHLGGSEGKEVSIGREPSQRPEPPPTPLPESRQISPPPAELASAKPSQKPETPPPATATPPAKKPEQPQPPKGRSLTTDERDSIAATIRVSLEEEKKLTQDTPKRVREAVDTTLAAFQVKRETLDEAGEAWLRTTIDKISNEIVERARAAATEKPKTQQQAPTTTQPPEEKEDTKIQQIKALLSKAKSEEPSYQSKDRDSRNRWENDTIISLANLLGKRDEIRNKHFREKVDIIRRALVPAIFPSQEQLRAAAPKFIMPPPQRPPQQGYGRRW